MLITVLFFLCFFFSCVSSTLKWCVGRLVTPIEHREHTWWKVAQNYVKRMYAHGFISEMKVKKNEISQKSLKICLLVVLKVVYEFSTVNRWSTQKRFTDVYATKQGWRCRAATIVRHVKVDVILFLKIRELDSPQTPWGTWSYKDSPRTAAVPLPLLWISRNLRKTCFFASFWQPQIWHKFQFLTWKYSIYP